MADPYIGEIRMFGGNFAPVDWLFCNGQLVSISENDALFNLIGTTYGGDGQSTFGLPNLQSRVPIHQGNSTESISYPLAQFVGQETVTLTSQQLGAHNHPFVASGGGPTGGGPGGGFLVSNNVQTLFTTDAAGVTAMDASAIVPQGGNQAHDNRMPYLCVNFIISMAGIYPTQA